MTRNPNTGPYVVSYRSSSGALTESECQTWVDACHLMRALLIDNFTDVTVRFV